MKLSAVTVKNIQALTQMEPFGMANPLPQFLFRRLRIVSKRLLGTKQSHLKLKLDDPETKFSENIATDAIAFKKGELDKSLMVGDLLDIVASLNINTWGGAATPQLIVKKIVKI
jgi:single-stranded-DNA-specific exonuclease